MIWKSYTHRIVCAYALPSLHDAVVASRFFSTLPSSASYHYGQREEDINNVRVLVWWDFENCQIPVGTNVLKVAQIITAAVRANGMNGPVEINAFGDVVQLSRANQIALSETGVNIHHIPRGGKNSADRSLIVNLMYWVYRNPPPAHLFLVSGDSDFSSILHRLRMNNYNILLACTDTASSALCSAASIMWQWNSLIKEEKFIGRHFNHSPDGPHGAWYSDYKCPIENPFLNEDCRFQSDNALNETAEVKPNLASKLRPVPFAVIKQIRHILSLYPGGIPLTLFRSELLKSNVGIDKEYYGYKKFMRFVCSMPHVMKILDTCDGYVVQKVSKKFHPLVYGSDCLSSSKAVNNGVVNSHEALDSSTSDRSNKPLYSYADVNAKPSSVKIRDICDQDAKLKPGIIVQDSPDGDLDHMPDSLKHRDDKSKVLLAKGQSAFGNGIRAYVSSEIENEKHLGVSSVSGNNNLSSMQSKDNVSTESTSSTKVNAGFHIGNHNEFMTVSDTSTIENKCVKGAKDDKDRGILAKILGWLKIWPQKSDDQRQSDLDSLNQFILTQNNFWKNIEDFILSPEGSNLVLQSITRKDMAQKLRNEGSTATRSLNEIDAIKLVDLIILEKKWIIESPSDLQPYKLARHVEAASDEKNKNTNPSEKSSNDILIDFKKLVKEILSEFPDGYNTSSFKSLFLNRYGYPLDIQKLGYKKLSSLFQILPGVEMKSMMIYPSSNQSTALSQDSVQRKENSDNLAPDASEKNDESDPLWAELGPIDDAFEKQKAEAAAKYEPSVTEDYFTDSESEGENSSSTAHCTRPEAKGREDDSSLLQILDSWYSQQKCETAAKVSAKSNRVPQLENKIESSQRKQDHLINRPYSFVVDSVPDSKDHLIDGILATIKKSDARTP